MINRAEIFAFGRFRVDVLRRSVERDGKSVALSGKAFEILLVLLDHRGQVVDKDELLRQVWPDTVVEENNITVAVSGLRKALGDIRGKPKWIVTVPGRGYTFVGEVQCDQPPDETIPTVGPVAAQSQTRSYKRAYLSVGVALLIVFLGLGMIAWFTTDWFTAKPLRSVAILPFRVVDEDSGNDYLGVGLTEAVITRLSSTQLVVPPLSTVSRFAEHDPVPSGRDLGVESVVDGSVQTTDNRIRVTVRLIKVSDGQSLWEQSFDVASGEALTLEDSISEGVLSRVSGPLTAEQQTALKRRPTANPSAYANYLRGEYYAEKYTEDGFRKALRYFQSAIEDDPTYALAYSGMADAYYDTSNLVFPPNEAMPRAKAAAQRAIELDPNLASAHVSAGIVASKYDWNWNAADREFQVALALDPNLADAHLWFGLNRAQVGDFDRAISEIRRAQQLDPLSSKTNAYLGLVLFWARRYDESIDQLHQAIAFDPTFLPDYVGLCWALDAKGDTRAALDACKQAVALEDSPWASLALARAQALAGDHTAAAASMAVLTPSKQFVSGYDRAAAYVALGKNDEAFVALDEAYQSRAEWMAYLKIDPQMDPIRPDPRYTALMKRMGL